MDNNNNQALLSFGYIYIVILGILKEAFYYAQLGIDYFKYASIADILISPFSDITESIGTILFFLLFIIVTLSLPVILEHKHDKSWVKSIFKLDDDDEAGPEENNKKIKYLSITMFCLGLMGFYLGAGLGSGHRVSKEIEKGELSYEDRITFINGETDTIKLLGKNSSFLFYMQKGENEIEITPINNGTLKSIIDTKEDEKD